MGGMQAVRRRTWPAAAVDRVHDKAHNGAWAAPKGPKWACTSVAWALRGVFHELQQSVTQFTCADKPCQTSSN